MVSNCLTPTMLNTSHDPETVCSNINSIINKSNEANINNNNSDTVTDEISTIQLPLQIISPSEQNIIPTALVIKNICFSVTKEELLSTMQSLLLPLPYALNYHYDHETGNFHGLAFANFNSSYEASLVFRILSGKKLQGRKLKVEYKRMLTTEQRKKLEKVKREKKSKKSTNRNTTANTNTNTNANVNINDKGGANSIPKTNQEREMATHQLQHNRQTQNAHSVINNNIGNDNNNHSSFLNVPHTDVSSSGNTIYQNSASGSLFSNTTLNTMRSSSPLSSSFTGPVTNETSPMVNDPTGVAFSSNLNQSQYVGGGGYNDQISIPLSQSDSFKVDPNDPYALSVYTQLVVFKNDEKRPSLIFPIQQDPSNGSAQSSMDRINLILSLATHFGLIATFERTDLECYVYVKRLEPIQSRFNDFEINNLTKTFDNINLRREPSFSNSNYRQQFNGFGVNTSRSLSEYGSRSASPTLSSIPNLSISSLSALSNPKGDFLSQGSPLISSLHNASRSYADLQTFSGSSNLMNQFSNTSSAAMHTSLGNQLPQTFSNGSNIPVGRLGSSLNCSQSASNLTASARNPNLRAQSSFNSSISNYNQMQQFLPKQNNEIQYPLYTNDNFDLKPSDIRERRVFSDNRGITQNQYDQFRRERL